MANEPDEVKKPEQEPVKTQWNTPQMTAPLLMLFVLAAMHLSRYFLASSESENVFLIVSLIQVLVLILPCMLYYLMKGKKFETPMRWKPLKLRHIPLILLSLLIYVFGILLIKYLFLLTSSQSIHMIGFFEAVSGKNTADDSLTGVLLSLVIIPAVCEEILFRGVLLSEYSNMGEANAVIISSICFAMLHFSVENFPVYLFVGLLLGIITVVSRSVIPAMILHLAGNAMNIFISDSFLRITMQKNGNFFVGFLLASLFGISLFFFLYSIEHIYVKMSQEDSSSAIPAKNLPYFAKVFLSPAFLILIAVFVMITVLT